MNIPLIIANILVGLAFVAHTFVGDKELKVLEPNAKDEQWLDKQEKWTMARSGWHWVSVDLGMLTIVLLLINCTDWIPHPSLLLKGLSIYFLIYGVVWFLTITLSKSFTKNYLKLGQWMFLLLTSALMYVGSY